METKERGARRTRCTAESRDDGRLLQLTEAILVDKRAREGENGGEMRHYRGSKGNGTILILSALYVRVSSLSPPARLSTIAGTMLEDTPTLWNARVSRRRKTLSHTKR